MKKILCLLFLLSCKDNYPQVAGDYQCVTNCMNPCILTHLVVEQDGDSVLVATSDINCLGDIDIYGNFVTECENNQACNGVFTDNTFTVEFLIQGVHCQKAEFQK